MTEDKSEPIYLDYAATAPLLPVVKNKMLEIMEMQATGQVSNPSSLYSAGQRGKEILEEARQNVAKLVNADPSEIIFTSGGSEANNTVANIFSNQKIAISAIEHPAMLEAVKSRTHQYVEIPVDRWGFIELAKIPKDSDLISVMLANNELGTIEPILALVDAYKTKSSFIHTDATQALGKIHIDVRQLGIDYMTLSAHKIGGPVGIGALYVKKDAPYRPLIMGGSQEHRRRAGTSNLLLAAGFGEAAKWAWDNWSCKQYAKVAHLRDRLRDRILNEIPYSSINSPNNNCLPNILNVSFQAAEGESIQLYLDLEGISISTGSACAAGDLSPSHVIMATRHDAEVAHNSIRFSLGTNTTSADIEHVMNVLPKIIKKLQGMSTIKLKERHE